MSDITVNFLIDSVPVVVNFAIEGGEEGLLDIEPGSLNVTIDKSNPRVPVISVDESGGGLTWEIVLANKIAEPNHGYAVGAAVDITVGGMTFGDVVVIGCNVVGVDIIADGVTFLLPDGATTTQLTSTASGDSVTLVRSPNLLTVFGVTEMTGNFTYAPTGRINSIGSWFEETLGGFIFGTQTNKITVTGNVNLPDDFLILYDTPDTSGSPIDLDCEGVQQAMFELGTIAADKTFTFSNVTNLRDFTCRINVTGTRAFTFPSAVRKLISTESRFNDGTQILTLTAGLYEFNIAKWGSDYNIVIS